MKNAVGLAVTLISLVILAACGGTASKGIANAKPDTGAISASTTAPVAATQPLKDSDGSSTPASDTPKVTNSPSASTARTTATPTHRASRKPHPSTSQSTTSTTTSTPTVTATSTPDQFAAFTGHWSSVTTSVLMSFGVKAEFDCMNQRMASNEAVLNWAGENYVCVSFTMVNGVPVGTVTYASGPQTGGYQQVENQPGAVTLSWNGPTLIWTNNPVNGIGAADSIADLQRS